MEKTLRKALEKEAEQRPIVEIADACGIAHGQLYRFLKGERSLTLPTATKLAEYLGLELRPKR